MLSIDFSLYETELPIVTSSKIFKNSKNEYHPDGLYSQTIFGPMKDYECECGNLKGKIHTGQRCSKCGVLCDTSDLRISTFAHIKLPQDIYVIFPPFRYIANKIFGKSNVNIIQKFDSHMYDDEYYFVYDLSKKKLVYHEDASDDIVENFKVYNIINLKKLYDYLLKNYQDLFDELGITNEHRDKLFINRIPVTPPDSRPVMKISSSRFSVNDVTKCYSEILKNSENKFINDVYNAMTDENEKVIYLANAQKKFQRSVDELYEFIINKQLGEKEGLLRSSMLGKTVEFSGRNVITCAPNIAPYMISINREASRTIYILEYLKHMLNNDEIDISDVSGIMQLMMYGIKNATLNLDPEDTDEVWEEIRKDLRCIFERPPVLFMYNDSGMLFDKLFEDKFKIDTSDQVRE